MPGKYTTHVETEPAVQNRSATSLRTRIGIEETAIARAGADLSRFIRDFPGVYYFSRSLVLSFFLSPWDSMAWMAWVPGIVLNSA